MNRTYLFCLLFFILAIATNAQYAVFHLDSSTWTINGKFKPVVKNLEFQVKDTTDYIMIGETEDDLLLVKFYLYKVPTLTGNYYIPEMMLSFRAKKNNKPKDDYQKTSGHILLSKEMNQVSTSSNFQSIHSLRASELKYTWNIDGSKLDYNDNAGLAVTNNSVDLDIKSLVLNDEVVTKKKFLELETGIEFQKVIIGTSNAMPVWLHYKMLHQFLAGKDEPVFISSLSFTRLNGTIDSVEFVNSNPSYPKTTYTGTTTRGNSFELKYKYSILLVKREEKQK